MSATVTAEAHGRVNLLGEHTDYNEGYVLPIAIPQKTRVVVNANGTSVFNVYAEDLAETAQFTIETAPEQQFAKYIYGCIRELCDANIQVPSVDFRISSDVPIGAGLSSSAALEVATLRAIRDLLHLQLDDVMIAKTAQQAEIKYAGVNCGIMDQMASSLAGTEHMLFLDTRSLERRLLPLPFGSEILVVDSGVPRTLAASKYNERRAECEEAARLLGAGALRDVNEANVLAKLPEPLQRRARHVVTENNRVLRAVESQSAEQFGVLMDASHESLRDDYEVSIPELDRLVAILQKHSDVYGARLTGAGFGGACVALCRDGTAAAVGRKAVREYNRKGNRGRVLVPPGNGS